MQQNQLDPETNIGKKVDWNKYKQHYVWGSKKKYNSILIYFTAICNIQLTENCFLSILEIFSSSAESKYE